MTAPQVAVVHRYKFQKLDVYRLALDYLDVLYELSKRFPSEEKYNLTSQIQRAGTSIVLNISEGLRDKPTLNKIGFSDWQ
jgi:four helix bundle protein